MKQSLSAILVGALMAFAGYAALFIAPDEKTMHAIQRIFYFHAPAGMVALIAFTVVFVANIAYLINRQPRWDWLAVSGAEVGVAFNTVVLITGPIWAKPAWGIWWAWDARLTSTLVLWLLYISLLLLRTLMPDPNRRAVFSAIYGIFLLPRCPASLFLHPHLAHATSPTGNSRRPEFRPRSHDAQSFLALLASATRNHDHSDAPALQTRKSSPRTRRTAAKSRRNFRRRTRSRPASHPRMIKEHHS